MKRNKYIDPLLMIIYSRQEDLLIEAENSRLAAQARGLLDKDGRPLQKKNTANTPIWRKTAWTLGRAAVSLGTWLMAR